MLDILKQNQARPQQRFGKQEHHRERRAGARPVAPRKQAESPETKRGDTRQRHPLVARWVNSMMVSMRGARGSITPLHSGQRSPQPAPEPVARTNAPHKTTRML